jgi:hypothetical protein
MRRLYVTSLDTWKSKVKVGVHSGDNPRDIEMRMHDLCHPQIGSHYIDLIQYTSPGNARLKHGDPVAWEALPEVQDWIANGKPILLCTSFAHSEVAEALWHDHPDVSVLPHPVTNGNDKIGTAKGKIKPKHVDALAALPGFDLATDTVITLATKASRIMPNVRLSNVL